MSKVFRGIAVVAGVVASVAAFVPGGQLVAAIASGVSTVSGTLATLTAKPPRAKGSASSITIGANQPMPYLMGEAYSGGAMIHDVAWGDKVNGVDNPYSATTIVYSVCGPIDGVRKLQADFSDLAFSGNAATGYYSSWLYRDFLPGAAPAPRALAAQWPGEPRWSADHKLSGMAAIKWSMRFDKKGKVFVPAPPQLGGIFGGVRAYDARFDSTVPGGSGPQRIDDETTWAYTRNPAAHACTYAYGRHANGQKIFGVDLGQAAIDLANVMAWANVCDANGWTVNGSIFEPGDKWNNLKEIAEAGCAEPVLTNGLLRFDFVAPAVPIDDITADDLADDEISMPAEQEYGVVINSVTGRYTSPDHKWEAIATDQISVADYIAEDGEKKEREFAFRLVTNRNQAAQLAAYKMMNSRELGPIVITCKPRLARYPIGTALTIAFAPLAGETVKIKGRSINPETGTVTLTLFGERASKHAFALGQTSTAPPATQIVAPELIDQAAANNVPLQTDRFPSPRPAEPVPGFIWHDAAGVPQRFEGRVMTLNGEVMTLNGDAMLDSGYALVRDQGVPTAIDAAAEAMDRAEDAALTATIDASGRLVTPGGPGAAIRNDLLNPAIASAATTATWAGVTGAGKPEDNADVTANAQIVVVPPPAQTVYRTWQGVIKDNQYSRTLTPKVERGGADIRTANDVSYSISTTGSIAATVNNSNGSADKGRITVTGGSNGSIILTVTVAGLTYPALTIPFTAVDDNPPTTGGGGGNNGGSDATLEDVSTTSFAVMSQQDAGESVFLIDIAAGQSINLVAPLTYTKSGTNTTATALEAKGQYRLQGGGSWIDMASHVTGTGAFWNDSDFEAQAGEITLNQSVSPAAGTYEVQLVGRKSNSAAGNLIVQSGAVTVNRS